MKKLIVIMALMVMSIGHAQEGRKGKRGEHSKNVTPQEMATVQSKKMTLALDLSDQQENEVYQLILTKVEKRKANKMSREDREKMTDDQKKAQRIKVMDEKIAAKRAMKKILNEDQYAKWEKTMQKRKHRNGERKMRGKRRN